MNLKFIVFGKIHHKIPCHDIVGTQIFMNDDTTHMVDAGGHTPGRIRQVTPRLGHTRAKLTHYPGQAFCPITWTKGTATSGKAKDVNFF